MVALTVTLSVALVGLDASSEPAEAGWGGVSGSTGCSDINAASGSNLGAFYYYLSSPMASAQDYVFANVIAPTDLSTYSSPTMPTDLIYRDLDYSTYCGLRWYTPGLGGTTGLTTCDSLAWAGGPCSSHTIRFSTVFSNGTSTSGRRALACHESGHAIGLTHASGSTSCMLPGTTSVTTWNPTEQGWINAFY